jgi:GT2 family glycosyltransferase
MSSVVIAIPTLLGGPTLSACLGALCRQHYRDFEVVVVNNGSGPPGVEAQPVNFPLRVICPGSNIGFGAAVNCVVGMSSAPLIATLNDDTEPDVNWLQTLVSAMESDAGIGMCASRIEIFGTAELDSVGMLVCRDGSSKQRGQSQSPSDWLVSGDALLPSGCAALYRRRLLDEIGLFDEDFFLYCEDTDLGLRARWAGWHCRYVADSVVWHHYSRSAGAFSPLKAKYVERNRLWVAIKNFPLSLLVWVPFVSLARYAWQWNAVRNHRGAASGFVRSGHSMGEIFMILWTAHWETFVRLPALFRKRAVCRSRRRIDAAEFSQLIGRYSISPKELAYAG